MNADPRMPTSEAMKSWEDVSRTDEVKKVEWTLRDWSKDKSRTQISKRDNLIGLYR